MSDRAPADRPPLDRGLHAILVLLCAVGLAAAVAFLHLIPQWVEATLAGQPGAFPSIWVALALALLSLTAAFALWQRRAWAREAFFLWAVLAALWQLATVVVSGATGEIDARGWLAIAAVAVAGLLLGGALVVYVWRHTRLTE